MKQQLNYPLGYNIPIFVPTTSGISRPGWLDRLRATAAFGDLRRNRCYDWLCKRIKHHQSGVINSITRDETERKRGQRFINNDQVKIDELIERSCLGAGHQSLQGQCIYNYVDQTCLAFHSAVGRIEDGASKLGRIGNGHQYGQNCVAGLFVRRDDTKALGLSSVSYFSTALEATAARQRIGRDERPITQRESYKWSLATEQAALRARGAEQVIHVIDREADDLNFLLSRFKPFKEDIDYTMPRQDYIIRAKVDRRVVVNQGRAHSQRGKIRDLLDKSRPVSCYGVNIPQDDRIRITADYSASSTTEGRSITRHTQRCGRRARLIVKYHNCQLDLVHVRKNKADMPVAQLEELLKDNELWKQEIAYVSVREVDQGGVPLAVTDQNRGKADEPIDWLILTTLPVSNAAAALEVVQAYRRRFPTCEQLFRGLKSDGMNVEKAQQQSVKGLQMIATMSIKQSALVMKMIAARDLDEGYELTDDFTEEEIEVLQLCETEYGSIGKANSNPHLETQLSWAVWIIARLGGWKPENKQRPPGPKTLQRGLDRYWTITEGVRLTKKANQIDVSQP